MGLTNTQYNSIMRIYSERQLRDRRDLDRRREEAYASIPRLSEIDSEEASLSIRKARFLLGAANAADVDLDAQLDELETERKALLAINGLAPDYLEPRYECPDCQDTGYIQDKKCACFRRLEIKLLYADSNLDEVLTRENFDTFSLDYYGTEYVDPKSHRTPREEAETALAASKDFAYNFSSSIKQGHAENLCIYGAVGVGKTFLTHCIARYLIDQGHSVVYLTAYDLFDMLGKYKFSSRREMTEAYESVFSSDLLIIDDLGAEMVNNFVSSELFTIVNERILAKKSTIISTNLSLENFRDSFSERTFSRMMGSYKLIHLSGRDIRIQKKLSGGN